MIKKSIIVKVIAFCLVFCILFTFTSAVIRDKRCEGEYDATNKVKGFYREAANSLDFVFIGSSQLYAHVAPAVLYRDYGMTSYDFAANEQPLSISYYYIKEALKYQKPKAIILEVFTVYGDDFEEEGVNHINIDDMPFSGNKIDAIKESVPDELQKFFVFDIYKYHSTWSGFYDGKWKYTFEERQNINKGYSPFIFARKYEATAKEEVKSVTEKTEIPNRAKEWLLKIISLTREEGVDLILLKTPNGNPERQKLYNSVDAFAKEQNIPFLNLNTILDGEAHVNVLQAEVITQSIGNYLVSKYGNLYLGNEESFPYKEQWEESVKSFEEAKSACLSAK